MANPDPILPDQVANHNTGFASSFIPTCGTIYDKQRSASKVWYYIFIYLVHG